MKRLSLVLVALLCLTGCASSPRDRALTAAQIIHTSLATTQDAEAVLCGQTPAEPTKCPSAAAAQIGLTDAKHQQINAVLAKTFRDEAALITILQRWTSGDAPLDVTVAVKNLQADVTQLRTILPAQAATVLNLIQQVLDNVASLQALLGGGR